MKITPIGILFFIIACIALWRVLRKFKHETMSIRSTVLWLTMWAVVGFSSIFPETLDYFVTLTRMGNRMLFILVISVFILLIMIFNLSSKLEKIQRDNMLMAQELSILRYRIDSYEKPSPAEPVQKKTKTET
jgi:hypothetical protein